MSIDIKSILSGLENEIADLAKTTFKNFASQATSDGKQLLASTKEDLTRWTQQLENKNITKADFETLLIGQKDLIQMSALTKAGVALSKIDEFKNNVFGLILNTLTGLI
ncbi:MAG: hypothetical protein ABI472_07215 [Ginsengibacter sp.]